MCDCIFGKTRDSDWIGAVLRSYIQAVSRHAYPSMEVCTVTIAGGADSAEPQMMCKCDGFGFPVIVDGTGDGVAVVVVDDAVNGNLML